MKKANNAEDTDILRQWTHPTEEEDQRTLEDRVNNEEELKKHIFRTY